MMLTQSSNEHNGLLTVARNMMNTLLIGDYRELPRTWLIGL